MEPIISIIIPCFNHGLYLEETLESIVTSTKKYIPEVIIVNDGSTDSNTIEVLKKVEDKGYHVLHQENLGLAKARNNGIQIARGKYILPLDSDNNLCYHYLNTAIDLLEKNKEIDIVYGNAKYIGEKSGVWKNHKLDIQKMLYANHIDACAIFKKKCWSLVGGYSEDMPYMGVEDWNFWLKCIIKNYNFWFLNEVCFEYRILSSSMLRNISENFNPEILAYQTLNHYDYYFKTLKEYNEKSHNILSGNIIKKVVKLILNHYNLYNY